jgi:hypothetical protein
MSSVTTDGQGQGVHFRALGWVAAVILCSTLGISVNSYLARRRAEAQAIAEVRAAARVRALEEQQRAAERARERELEIKAAAIRAQQEHEGRERRGNALIDALSLRCDEPTARGLLGQGADLTLQDYNDRTALMLASRHGCLGIVNLILSHGADINYMNMWGMTALDWAQRENQQTVADLLIKNGGKPGTRYR